MVFEHSRDGAVAILTLAYPPANALGLALRRALHEFFDSVRHDATVQAVVVRGAGTGFCAGGDRAEFGTEAADARPTLSRDVLDAIERCGRPVVAALHGYAVGGGFELALACDARVAHAMTRIALPEVGIGLFPLSATQRLPRLLGLGCAADIMLAGEVLRADAPSLSLCFDRIVTTDDALMETALQIARAAVTTAPRPVRERAIPGDPSADLIRVRARHPPDERTAAQQALLDALEAAVASPNFAAGLDRAQQLFDRLGGTQRPSPPIRPG